MVTLNISGLVDGLKQIVEGNNQPLSLQLEGAQENLLEAQGVHNALELQLAEVNIALEHQGIEHTPEKDQITINKESNDFELEM
jgi:hypothetical protein